MSDLSHEYEMSRLREAHARELAELRTQHDQVLATLGARYENLLSTATALGAFAENHRKFVSAWGSVRACLRHAADHAHVALPRAVVLTLHEEGDWHLQMIQVRSGTDQSEDKPLFEESRFDYQDAPCPTLLASWCERQMNEGREAAAKAIALEEGKG